MDDDVFDLYEDLEEFDTSEKLKEANKTIKDLEGQLNECRRSLTQMELANKELTKQNKTLLKNNSSLLKTAKHEIQRKGNEIDALMREKDNICFRRLKNAKRAQMSQCTQTEPISFDDSPHIRFDKSSVDDCRQTEHSKRSNPFAKHNERKSEVSSARRRSPKWRNTSAEPQDRSIRTHGERRSHGTDKERNGHERRKVSRDKSREGRYDRFEIRRVSEERRSARRGSVIDGGKEQSRHSNGEQERRRQIVQPTISDARDVINMKRGRETKSPERDTKKRRSKSSEAAANILEQKMCTLFGTESPQSLKPAHMASIERSLLETHMNVLPASQSNHALSNLNEDFQATEEICIKSGIKTATKTDHPFEESKIRRTVCVDLPVSTLAPTTKPLIWSQASPKHEVVCLGIREPQTAKPMVLTRILIASNTTPELDDVPLDPKTATNAKPLKVLESNWPSSSSSDDAVILDPRSLKSGYCTGSTAELIVITAFPPDFADERSTLPISSIDLTIPDRKLKETHEPNVVSVKADEIIGGGEIPVRPVETTSQRQNQIGARRKSVHQSTEVPSRLVKRRKSCSSVPLAIVQEPMSFSSAIRRCRSTPRDESKAMTRHDMNSCSKNISLISTSKEHLGKRNNTINPVDITLKYKAQRLTENLIFKQNLEKSIETLGRIPKKSTSIAMVNEADKNAKVLPKPPTRSKNIVLGVKVSTIKGSGKNQPVENSLRTSIARKATLPGKSQQLSKSSDCSRAAILKSLIGNVKDAKNNAGSSDPVDATFILNQNSFETGQDLPIESVTCVNKPLQPPKQLTLPTPKPLNPTFSPPPSPPPPPSSSSPPPPPPSSTPPIPSTPPPSTPTPPPPPPLQPPSSPLQQPSLSSSCFAVANGIELKTHHQSTVLNPERQSFENSPSKITDDKNLPEESKVEESQNNSEPPQQLIALKNEAYAKPLECLSPIASLPNEITMIANDENCLIQPCTKSNPLSELSENIRESSDMKQPLPVITNASAATSLSIGPNEEVEINLHRRQSKRRRNRKSSVQNPNKISTPPPAYMTSSDMEIDEELQQMHTTSLPNSEQLTQCIDNKSLIVKSLNQSIGEDDLLAIEMRETMTETSCAPAILNETTLSTQETIETIFELPRNVAVTNVECVVASIEPETKEKILDNHDVEATKTTLKSDANRVYRSYGRVSYYVEQAPDGSNEETIYITRKKKKKSKK